MSLLRKSLIVSSFHRLRLESLREAIQEIHEIGTKGFYITMGLHL